MRRRLKWVVPGLVAAVVVGCGPGNGLNLGRVSGKVTYKGKPVEYGSVYFTPDASKGTVAFGTIAKDGTYTLSTDEAGDGAVVGRHKVSVIGLDPTPTDTAKELPKPEQSPVDFMKGKAQLLSKSAPRSKSGEETYTDRGGRVYRYVTPKKLGSAETSGLEIDVTSGSNTVNIEVSEDGTARISK